MTIQILSAVAYTSVTLFTVFFQIGLALGRPWGPYTMGGRYKASLPPLARVAMGFQSCILTVLALVVLDRARFLTANPFFSGQLSWIIWVPVGVSAQAFVLNSITPSSKERRLWQPITAVMFATSLIVACGK